MNSPSVFVIEDDFAVRDSLVLLLRAEGLRARGFANGSEFFFNLPNDPVACIVTDLDGPLLQRLDRPHPIRFERGVMYAPDPALWG